MEGTVQSFNMLKGYGWILADWRTRIYFHVSQWKSDTKPVVGLLVEFDIAPPRKDGQHQQAMNITPVAEALYVAVKS
jgi:cold shock CspA family protein